MAKRINKMGTWLECSLNVRVENVDNPKSKMAFKNVFIAN